MKIRTIMLVALAIMCGGSAAVGVNQLRRQGNTGPQVNSVPVLMAAKDVARGVLLSPSLVTVRNWPEHLVPPGALTTIEDVDRRTVLNPLVKGEPILQAKLASKDSGRGLASMIPPGMRAFTIRTPHVASGVGGFILPGNRVDVLLTTTSNGQGDRTGGGATTTLLQNIQILAVAQRLDAPDTNKVDLQELKSVTLLVTPNQATKLDLGMNKGLLHLSLRNPEDHAEADARPTTMSQLRFHQEQPVKSPFQFANLMGTVAGIVGKAKGTASNQVDPLPRRRSRSVHIHTLRGTHRGNVRIDVR